MEGTGWANTGVVCADDECGVNALAHRGPSRGSSYGQVIDTGGAYVGGLAELAVGDIASYASPRKLGGGGGANTIISSIREDICSLASAGSLSCSA